MTVTEWQMERARMQAHRSVLMQGLAALARRNPHEHEWIKDLVRRADETAAAVRPEDLVRVTLR